MRYPAKTLHSRQRRLANTLPIFVLVTPVLLGMLGLAIDAGLVMAAQRKAQNAADAAALAAALDLSQGRTPSYALQTAQTFLNDMGLSNVTLTLNAGASDALNVPPQDPGNTGSPYKGNGNYAEVILSIPVQTLFIQVLGVKANQQVSARAVAGSEPVGAGEGALLLDPTISQGIVAISNNVQLIVNGDITVNANGIGQNQDGQTVGTGTGGAAITTSSSTRTPPTIIASRVFSVGGMTNINNLATYDASFPGFYNPNNPNPNGPPLFAPSGITPDPLLNLVTPTSSNGVTVAYPKYLGNGQWGTAASPQQVSLRNGDNVTVPLGIFQSISIQNGATVTLKAGIYVLAGGGLSMNGGTLQDKGAGVMIYNTASSYNPSTGAPDNSDGGTKPTQSYGGTVSITGSSTVNLSPISSSSSPFNGMVFYQRRWNSSTLSIGGNSSNITFSGGSGQIPSTLYAKWANFTLGGSGKYNAQFLVGSITINGGAAVTINATGKSAGKGSLVFLVE